MNYFTFFNIEDVEVTDASLGRGCYKKWTAKAN